jgi:hypothetical protein
VDIVWVIGGGIVAGVSVLSALLALIVRRRRRRFSLPPFGRGWNGGEPGGVREPRRPLVPAGAASAALPEPREEIHAPARAPQRIDRRTRRHRLAS